MDRVNDPRFGRLYVPDNGNIPKDDKPWAIDNGAFVQFKPTRYLRLLDQCRTLGLQGCLFVVVPDVVADAEATQRLYEEWAPTVRTYGYPLAYVAQDGATPQSLPWDEFDVLFLGGSTAFKLSPMMRNIADCAHDRGKPIHAGRVNSMRRLRWAKQVHARTTDGTFISMFPDIGYSKMSSYLTVVESQGELPL